MSKWTREAPPHPTQRSQQPGQGSSPPDFSSSTSTTRLTPSQNANAIPYNRSDTNLAVGSKRDKLAALVKLPRVDGASNADANNEGRQHSRVVRKDRTSILARRGDNVAIPSHSRVSQKHGDHSLKVKRNKTSLPKEKQVAADVYIPSTVSVGTLSRLLGVKLGQSALQFTLTHFTMAYHPQRPSSGECFEQEWEMNLRTIMVGPLH